MTDNLVNANRILLKVLCQAIGEPDNEIESRWYIPTSSISTYEIAVRWLEDHGLVKIERNVRDGEQEPETDDPDRSAPGAITLVDPFDWDSHSSREH